MRPPASTAIACAPTSRPGKEVRTRPPCAKLRSSAPALPQAGAAAAAIVGTKSTTPLSQTRATGEKTTATADGTADASIVGSGAMTFIEHLVQSLDARLEQLHGDVVL